MHIIMGKIKKIYKIPLFVIPSILILTTICFVSLRSPKVQTWLFERLTNRISKHNDIDISAGSIRFTFFNHIEVNNLLIKDNTADTMLYSPVVKAGIRKIQRKERLLSLGHVDIDSPIIKLQPDTNNVLNLESLTKLLTNEDTAKRNKDLLIRQIV